MPRWQKITGTTNEQLKRSFGPGMGWNLAAALLTSYILAHFIFYTDQATGTSGIMGGMVTALWVWLGFSVTTLVSSGALDHRDKKLIALQGGERLATLLLMGLILGAFMR